MIKNRPSICIFALVFVCIPTIGEPPAIPPLSSPHFDLDKLYFNNNGISFYTLDRAIPLESKIAKPCIDYLKSKGFRNITLKTSNDIGFFRSDVYAFTIYGLEKYRSTIFISPTMIQSIKDCLDSNQPISMYDKFALLHELGHLHPYGHQYAIYNKIAETLGVFGIMGMLFSTPFVAEFWIGSNPHTEKLVFIKKCSIASFIVSLSALGVSTYIHSTKVLPILRKFKKWTFTHADKEFEKHVKRACEEKDADLFALALLSTQELNELLTYFSYYANLHKNLPIDMQDSCLLIDENGYHPTSQERCTMIVAELEKRKI